VEFALTGLNASQQKPISIGISGYFSVVFVLSGIVSSAIQHKNLFLQPSGKYAKLLGLGSTTKTVNTVRLRARRRTGMNDADRLATLREKGGGDG
jgi:hypothetical protein